MEKHSLQMSEDLPKALQCVVLCSGDKRLVFRIPGRGRGGRGAANGNLESWGGKEEAEGRGSQAGTVEPQPPPLPSHELSILGIPPLPNPI